MRTDLPDDATLAQGLRELLGAPLRVLERVTNPYESSAASEVVICTHGDAMVRVLCKYDNGADRTCYGHRGDLRYEAYVYRTILEELGTSAPQCFGLYTERGRPRSWLVLEHVDPAIRVSWAPDAQGVYAAARWIGAFHAATAVRADEAASGLRRYDAAYLRGWADRTSRFGRVHPLGGGWLERLSERADAFVVPLLEVEPVIVHGEFYKENILLSGDRVVPVDWESTAIAAGELDLASLTERWPSVVARRCAREYARARWPRGAPPTFATALAAARVYWQLRWLGDRPEWAEEEQSRWRFTELRTQAELLGLTAGGL